MKRFILISLLLFWIVLAWCSKKWLSQKELFDMKKECSTYSDLLTKNSSWFSIFQQKKLVFFITYDVFYSPQENSCVFGAHREYETYWRIHTWIVDSYEIRDYVTKKLLYSRNCNLDEESVLQCFKPFKTKLQELKTENKDLLEYIR
jgi:hypothetical protein